MLPKCILRKCFICENKNKTFSNLLDLLKFWLASFMWFDYGKWFTWSIHWVPLWFDCGEWYTGC